MPPGYVHHVLNRAVARLSLFQKEGDYSAFERVMAEAYAKHPTRLLAYCLMPNLNRPETEAELTALRQSVNRGTPFGNPDRQEQMTLRYHFERTLRPRGRPKKKPE